MFKNIFHYFYAQPMNVVMIELIAAYLLWSAFAVITKPKLRRVLSLAAMIIAGVLILSATIIFREPGTRSISPVPFQSFIDAQINIERYRSMLMNVFLFVPLGLSLPFALPDKVKRKVIFTVSAAMIFSICIEASQYIFCLGWCETDDVIMNTFGAFIGSTSYWLSRQLSALIEKRRHKNIPKHLGNH